jgi:dipeptidyl aminopeptidase/acylaminoacyl peptidase
MTTNVVDSSTGMSVGDPGRIVVDVDEPTLVTPEMCVSGRDITEPRLSPDGSQVAMVIRWESTSGLVLVPAVGGPERLVSTGPPPAAGRGLGGGCFDWAPAGNAVVYAGTDGAVWWQPLGAGPCRRLAQHDDRVAQAPVVSPDGSFVVYVVDQAEVWRTWIAEGTPPERLDDGSADFCFDPSVSPASDEVAWVAWNVPDMPWDRGRAQRRSVDASSPDRVVTSLTTPSVATVSTGAIQQWRWTPDGTPISVRDDTGWLNVWLADAPLVDEPWEHAGPSWGMGQRSYAVSPDSRRVAFTRNERGFGRLCVVEVATGDVTQVARGVHGQLSWAGPRLAALRSGARTPTQVVVYDVGRPSADRWERRVLAVGPVAGWDDVELPEPELLEVPLDDIVLHGRRYVAGRGRTICWIHGGPTDQWQVEFMPRLAYWWSQGWDILVPDPRGSTGHGRAYQQALRGGWGRLDVDDTAAVLRASHDRGWSSPEATVVMGGSSGGLTALGVLGRHQGLAAAGAVSYPVTDLADLADRSHRFEAHYTLSLVGGFDDTDRYRDHSPVSYAHLIDVPVLITHGDNDPVVPLDQSLALEARLRAAGADVELHVMEGEGHGYRHRQNKLAEYELVANFLARTIPAAATG